MMTIGLFVSTFLTAFVFRNQIGRDVCAPFVKAVDQIPSSQDYDFSFVHFEHLESMFNDTIHYLPDFSKVFLSEFLNFAHIRMESARHSFCASEVKEAGERARMHALKQLDLKCSALQREALAMAEEMRVQYEYNISKVLNATIREPEALQLRREASECRDEMAAMRVSFEELRAKTAHGEIEQSETPSGTYSDEASRKYRQQAFEVEQQMKANSELLNQCLSQKNDVSGKLLECESHHRSLSKFANESLVLCENQLNDCHNLSAKMTSQIQQLVAAAEQYVAQQSAFQREKELNIVCNHQLTNLTQLAEQLINERDIANQTIQKLNTSLNEAVSALEQLSTPSKSACAEHVGAALTKRNHELDERMKTHSEEFHEQLVNCTSSLLHAQETIVSLNASLLSLNSSSNTTECDCNFLIQTAVATTNASLLETESQLQLLREEHEQVTKSLQNRIRTLTSEKATAETALLEMRSAQTTSQQPVNDSTSSLGFDDQPNAVQNCHKQISDALNQVNQYHQIELSNLQTNIGSLKNQLNECQVNVTGLGSLITMLHQANETNYYAHKSCENRLNDTIMRLTHHNDQTVNSLNQRINILEEELRNFSTRTSPYPGDQCDPMINEIKTQCDSVYESQLSDKNHEISRLYNEIEKVRQDYQARITTISAEDWLAKCPLRNIQFYFHPICYLDEANDFEVQLSSLISADCNCPLPDETAVEEARVQIREQCRVELSKCHQTFNQNAKELELSLQSVAELHVIVQQQNVQINEQRNNLTELSRELSLQKSSDAALNDSTAADDSKAQLSALIVQAYRSHNQLDEAVNQIEEQSTHLRNMSELVHMMTFVVNQQLSHSRLSIGIDTPQESAASGDDTNSSNLSRNVSIPQMAAEHAEQLSDLTTRLEEAQKRNAELLETLQQQTRINGELKEQLQSLSAQKLAENTSSIGASQSGESSVIASLRDQLRENEVQLQIAASQLNACNRETEELQSNIASLQLELIAAQSAHQLQQISPTLNHTASIANQSLSPFETLYNNIIAASSASPLIRSILLLVAAFFDLFVLQLILPSNSHRCYIFTILILWCSVLIGMILLANATFIVLCLSNIVLTFASFCKPSLSLIHFRIRCCQRAKLRNSLTFPSPSSVPMPSNPISQLTPLDVSKLHSKQTPIRFSPIPTPDTHKTDGSQKEQKEIHSPSTQLKISNELPMSRIDSDNEQKEQKESIENTHLSADPFAIPLRSKQEFKENFFSFQAPKRSQTQPKRPVMPFENDPSEISHAPMPIVPQNAPQFSHGGFELAPVHEKHLPTERNAFRSPSIDTSGQPRRGSMSSPPPRRFAQLANQQLNAPNINDSTSEHQSSVPNSQQTTPQLQANSYGQSSASSLSSYSPRRNDFSFSDSVPRMSFSGQV